MSKQEIKVITKIIREVSLYLMLNGFKDFLIETKNTSDTTRILITMENPNEKTLSYMKEKLSMAREIEVETYGWELAGDIDSKSGLDMVGLFVDECKVSKDGNKTVISLLRINRYKD